MDGPDVNGNRVDALDSLNVPDVSTSGLTAAFRVISDAASRILSLAPFVTERILKFVVDAAAFCPATIVEEERRTCKCKKDEDFFQTHDVLVFLLRDL